MSFFRTLFESCCGPAGFEVLRQHSWIRVIWHMVLLVVLSSALIGAGEYLRLRQQWRGARSQFIEIFGEELYFTKNGILPGKEQNIGRCQELPYNGLLIYAAKDGQKVYSEKTLRDRNFIILWSSAQIGVAVRGAENRWITVQRNPDNFLDMHNEQELETFEQMRQKLVAMIAAPPTDKWYYGKNMPEYIPVYKLYNFFRSVRAVSVAFAYAFQMLFLMILGTGIYTVCYRLINSGGKYRFLSGLEQWKIGIYAAFPVILVDGAFPMLQLPFVQYYGAMFVVGWVIYQFVVLNYLSSLHAPPPAEEQGGDQE